MWQAWHLAASTFVLRGRCATGALGGALGRRWSPLVAVPRHFPWQAWHLATSIFVSCGRHGTWRHPPAFHVAGVALGDIYLRFAWQVCYRLHLVARLVAVGRRWSPVTPRHFAWQAWRLATSIYLRFMWQACHLATSTCVSRGRRGTWRHLPSFCVAGVVQVALGRRWSPLVAGDAAALCVAGVALGDMYLRFMWQACHLATSTCVLRGKRGRNRMPSR